MEIINMPADIWRLILKDHPECRRCFRMVSTRARDIFSFADLIWKRKLTEDVSDLCRTGCPRVLSLYPKAALQQFSQGNMVVAIQHGHLEIVKMILAVETNFGIYVAAYAAAYKQYDIVRWVVANYDPKHENPADQMEEPFRRNCMIAENGDLAIVKEFFHLDPTCSGWYIGAINGKRLDIIQWLYEQKCELSEKLSQRAAGLDSLEIFQWLCEHGCPVNPKACARWSCPAIRDWIHQRYPNSLE